METKTCSCCGFDVDIIHRATKAVRAADTKFKKVGGTSRHWIHECFLPELEREGLRLVDDNIRTYNPATHVCVSRETEERVAKIIEYDVCGRENCKCGELAAELRAALEVGK